MVFITIGLANNPLFANSSRRSSGDKEFSKMVARHHAAVVTSGTFWLKAPRKLLWVICMVAGGRFLKYSKWEDFGTNLGLRSGNKPEMITAHKLARIFHRLWTSGEHYTDPGIDAYEQQYLDRILKNLKIKAQAFGLELIPISDSTLGVIILSKSNTVIKINEEAVLDRSRTAPVM